MYSLAVTKEYIVCGTYENQIQVAYLLTCRGILDRVMIGALGSRSSGPGSNPSRANCIFMPTRCWSFTFFYIPH